MADEDFSPRLRALCKDQPEIREVFIREGLFTTQDLGNLSIDSDCAADKLRLSAEARHYFRSTYAVSRVRAESNEQRMQQEIDVLNSEGHVMMTKPRSEVHRNGFWHRCVNVWVICPSTARVLLAQRAASKDTDPRKWTCVCGRVPSGELSKPAAVNRLHAELSIKGLDDEQITLMFAVKCERAITTGIFAGQLDGAFIDVYAALLTEEIPLWNLHLDSTAKESVQWVSVEELTRSLLERDERYVIATNEEYQRNLIRHLRKVCKDAAVT